MVDRIDMYLDFDVVFRDRLIDQLLQYPSCVLPVGNPSIPDSGLNLGRVSNWKKNAKIYNRLSGSNVFR